MAVHNRRKMFLLLLLRRRLLRKRERNRKRCCVRGINQKRKQKGEYFNLVREMKLSDHESFFKYFRMSPCLFEKLLCLVAPLIQKCDQKREPISPANIEIFSNRGFPSNNCFNYRLGHSTVNNIIPETCQALWVALAPVYIQCPSTPKLWADIAQEFWEKWNFPLCIGALD